jgi:hypothetical protein
MQSTVAADQVYQPGRAIELAAPLAQGTSIPGGMPPGAGGFGRPSRKDND